LGTGQPPSDYPLSGAVQSLRLLFAWNSGNERRTTDSQSDREGRKGTTHNNVRPAERWAHIIPGERRDGFRVKSTVDYLTIWMDLDRELLPESLGLREFPASAIAEAWCYEESWGWQLVRVIHDECAAGGREDSPYVETAAKLLTMHIIRALLTHRSSLTALCHGGLPPVLLDRACGYMTSRLGENPSLQDIAATAGLSAGHFHSHSSSLWDCLRIDGCAVKRSKEQKLLRDTRLAMSEIAAVIGYSNQSAFGVAFRSETGLIPTQWRRHHLM
jgi:AraC-like DNA-binding protein